MAMLILAHKLSRLKPEATSLRHLFREGLTITEHEIGSCDIYTADRE
jgi:hypothetical protein